MYEQGLGVTMKECQIQPASRHALPLAASSVHDRRISLFTVCHEEATYQTKLKGAAQGRMREGATPYEFVLCQNHSQLITQIDTELLEDGWSTVFAERPQTLA
jgi:hypothetical protein